MSLKRKTEKAVRQLLLDATAGMLPPGPDVDTAIPAGQMVLYTSQEPQEGRRFPCAAINLQQQDKDAIDYRSRQEDRRLLITVLGTAMRESGGETEPAEIHKTFVDQIHFLLRSYSLGSNRLGSLARAITTAALTAGETNFCCLAVYSVRAVDVEPIDGHLAESFELNLRLLEATA
jgi:hypothetical protein